MGQRLPDETTNPIDHHVFDDQPERISHIESAYGHNPNSHTNGTYRGHSRAVPAQVGSKRAPPRCPSAVPQGACPSLRLVVEEGGRIHLTIDRSGVAAPEAASILILHLPCLKNSPLPTMNCEW